MWVVDDVATARRVAARGVGGIVSNYPLRMLNELDAERGARCRRGD